MVLFDANLLICAHATHSPFHEAAKRLRDRAASGALQACLSPQVLCEFFSVCTNARVFRPALTPQEASKQMAIYWTHSEFRIILPTDRTVQRLHALLTDRPVIGQHVFDAFLAATMLENNVRTIYTQNVKDFEIYHDLQVINPLVDSGHRPT